MDQDSSPREAGRGASRGAPGLATLRRAMPDGARPLPALCRALWDQARASGIALGTLYVVERPPTDPDGRDDDSNAARGAMDAMDAMDASTRVRSSGGAPGAPAPAWGALLGAYHQASGDVWVRAGDEREMAQTLLHELAHAARRGPPPRTVDEDWDEEVAAWRLARELALAWGVPALLPLRDLARELVATERLRRDQHAAARLDGVTHPAAARAAYAALRRQADARRWDDAAFAVALAGRPPGTRVMLRSSMDANDGFYAQDT